LGLKCAFTGSVIDALVTDKSTFYTFFYGSAFMGKETELKLAVNSEEVPRLKTASFWYKYAGCSKATHLRNTYFDTPDHQLNRANAALRIREKQGCYVQTLKTKGKSVNGLSHRGEWEWGIAHSELNVDTLRQHWSEGLPRVDIERLEAQFSTDFERTSWIIAWDSPAATVEAALDIVFVTAGKQKKPICELELELLEGYEGALRSIAGYLQSEFSLLPADKSKAERGFELVAHK